MTEQELKEIVSRFRPGRETLPEKQTILRLIEEIDRLNLQNQEIQKAARALLDKLNRSWVGKDYAEYAFSEDAKSHPMADLEKLLTK